MISTVWHALALVAMLISPSVAVSEKLQLSANPMRKIVTMLQDMQKEIEREGEMEKELFEKAMCACETGQKELQKTIEDATAESDSQASTIEAQTAEKSTLTQEIEDHKTSKAQAEKDLAEATSIRDKAHKNFLKEEKDNKHSLQGLNKAIPAIEKGMGASSLMQTKVGRHLRRTLEVTRYLSPDERTGVLAFLDSSSGDEDQDGDTVQAPGTGEILGILKNMKDEMSKDLGEMQEREKADFESFNELKAAKTQEIDVNAKAIISKDKRIGGLALSLSEANHALEDAKEELANAQKMLDTMKKDCAGKQKEMMTRAKSRADEMTAIGDAIKILNDDDALEVFSKAKSFVQQPQRMLQTYDAFLQVSTKLRIKHTHASAVRHHQKEEPEGEAQKLVSHMIEGMVSVLHDEDVGDEHKKDWCANETAVNHQLEAEKKTLMEKTEASITESEDAIATLVEEIKALTEKIQELDKMVHEATEQRKGEHQEFVDAFATSTTAIRLVTKAIKRLEKFYSPEKAAAERKAATDAALKAQGLALLSKRSDTHRSDAKAAAMTKMENALMPGGFDDFVQVKARMRVKQPEIPATPSALFQKQESGGVIGLMNEFVTDIKLDMTEAETEEKFNAKDYVRIMTEAQETRTGDTKALNEKKKAKATADTKLLEDKELFEATKDEHHNLELYLAQLHGECDFLLRNYETRHEARIDEEVGLEEAKTIVTHEEPPNYREVEKVYEEEHSAADVDQNFPGTPVSDVPK
jgi:hypothetical protein